MSNNLLELIKIMPLSGEAIDRPREDDWKRCEQRLGIEIPVDYKEFINYYGGGYAANYFMLCYPRERRSANCLELLADLVLDSERILQKEFPELYDPYTFWPDRGGLLPFGQSVGSTILHWRTIGNPKDWSIVVQDGSQFEEFKAPFTETFLSWIKHQEATNVIPDTIFAREFMPVKFDEM